MVDVFNLKTVRKKKKISQQKLADIIGVSRSTIAMWETGGSQPDNDSLSRLASFFNCTTDYLLGRTDEPEYELRTDLPEALKKIGIEAVEMLADSDLTPDEIQTLIAFAREWKAKKESSKNQ